MDFVYDKYFRLVRFCFFVIGRRTNADAAKHAAHYYHIFNIFEFRILDSMVWLLHLYEIQLFNLSMDICKVIRRKINLFYCQSLQFSYMRNHNYTSVIFMALTFYDYSNMFITFILLHMKPVNVSFEISKFNQSLNYPDTILDFI